MKFTDTFTDFIFLEDVLEPADIIFVPGNGYPQMAERAAELWRQRLAPVILPSGKYSLVTGHFGGVLCGQDRYGGPYKTEWEFLADVLVKNGVSRRSILKEDQATYTWQNAIYSRAVTDREGMGVKKAIICCKAQHARRCKLYYQLEYPDTELLICPCDVGINRDNWYLSGEGIDEVLGEMERCGGQFHQILRNLSGLT